MIKLNWRLRYQVCFALKVEDLHYLKWALNYCERQYSSIFSGQDWNILKRCYFRVRNKEVNNHEQVNEFNKMC